MQLAIVEFARNVIGWKDAHSSELNLKTTSCYRYHARPEGCHESRRYIASWTLSSCVLENDTRAYKLYDRQDISERHRHRYEVNNKYRDELSAAGLKLSGLSPDKHIVEMIELPDHPFFLGTGSSGIQEQANRRTRFSAASLLPHSSTKETRAAA